MNRINGKKEISFYIHIPFCAKKCHYCDFLSFACYKDGYDIEDKKTFNERVDSYISALLGELREQCKQLNNHKVTTIFIGGGTPSLIDEKYIVMIMDEISSLMEIDEAAEITIECNPGTITKNKVDAYIASGINRVSLGLQSTDNKVLKELGRIHDYETFFDNFMLLRDCGFENINVDLMFALPNQSQEQWMDTLKKVIELEPEHISVYSLIIEENTQFMKRYENDELVLPTEEADRKMFWNGNELLAKHGYHHYEISNYAKEGRESRHNKVYWELKEYVGIGLGAASYIDGERRTNIRDLNGYVLAEGDLDNLIIEVDVQEVQNQKEEFLFLGLRMMDGISVEDYQWLFGESIDERYGEVLERLLDERLILVEAGRVFLTEKGIDVSNYVFTQFLL